MLHVQVQCHVVTINLVIALALMLTTGFNTGCLFYYWLSRRHA